MIDSQKNKNKFKPSNANLIDEIKRRKKLLDPSKVLKVNSQMTKTDDIDWLQENALTDHMDIIFITFLNVFNASEAEKTANQRCQWTGMVSYLHLIYCITDIESIKEAFENSFSCLSQEELDGRHTFHGEVKLTHEEKTRKFLRHRGYPTP